MPKLWLTRGITSPPLKSDSRSIILNDFLGAAAGLIRATVFCYHQKGYPLKILTLFVGIMLFASAASAAASDHYTATLAQPLDKKKELIVEHNVWRCEGTTCVLVSAPMDANSVSSCRQLKRQVGTLSGYGNAEKPFDDKKLAACNGSG